MLQIFYLILSSLLSFAAVNCSIPQLENHDERFQTDILQCFCVYLDLKSILSLRSTCHQLLENPELEKYWNLFNDCLENNMLLLNEESMFVCITGREVDDELILQFLYDFDNSEDRFGIRIRKHFTFPFPRKIIVRNFKSLLKLVAFDPKYARDTWLQIEHFDEGLALLNQEYLQIILQEIELLHIGHLSESELDVLSSLIPPDVGELFYNFRRYRLKSLSLSNELPRNDMYNRWQGVSRRVERGKYEMILLPNIMVISLISYLVLVFFMLKNGDITYCGI